MELDASGAGLLDQLGHIRVRGLGRFGVVAHHGGPQDLQYVLQVLQGPGGAVPDHAHGLGELFRRRPRGVLERARVHGQQRQPVREHVVHLPGDLLPGVLPRLLGPQRRVRLRADRPFPQAHDDQTPADGTRDQGDGRHRGRQVERPGGIRGEQKGHGHRDERACGDRPGRTGRAHRGDGEQGDQQGHHHRPAGAEEDQGDRQPGGVAPPQPQCGAGEQGYEAVGSRVRPGEGLDAADSREHPVKRHYLLEEACRGASADLRIHGQARPLRPGHEHGQGDGGRGHGQFREPGAATPGLSDIDHGETVPMDPREREPAANSYTKV